MRNTLICTVGTSLFGNLNRINSEEENLQEIYKSFTRKDWDGVSNALLKFSPTDRICGAEINTIEESKKKKWLELKNIIFLVSQTEEGKNTGNVLTKYFKNRKDLGISSVESIEIKGLQDENPKDFKSLGLRNLIREVGNIIERHSFENTAIDATGGYKAQIAVAVLIGQALDIPVYYKHERFSEIIDFPPLPISLDYDILGKNADILTQFERGEVYSNSELGEIDEKLNVFLTEVHIDGNSIYELNAIGQLYLTSFRLRYPNIVDLKPVPENERKFPTFGNDHHYPIGFEKFVKKIWEENKWIKSCYTLPFGGQAGILPIGFKVKKIDKDNILVGEYKDKDKFGARFRIILSDESNESLNWAADFLNREFS